MLKNMMEIINLDYKMNVCKVGYGQWLPDKYRINDREAKNIKSMDNKLYDFSECKDIIFPVERTLYNYFYSKKAYKEKMEDLSGEELYEFCYNKLFSSKNIRNAYAKYFQNNFKKMSNMSLKQIYYSYFITMYNLIKENIHSKDFYDKCDYRNKLLLCIVLEKLKDTDYDLYIYQAKCIEFIMIEILKNEQLKKEVKEKISYHIFDEFLTFRMPNEQYIEDFIKVLGIDIYKYCMKNYKKFIIFHGHVSDSVQRTFCKYINSNLLDDTETFNIFKDLTLEKDDEFHEYNLKNLNDKYKDMYEASILLNEMLA